MRNATQNTENTLEWTALERKGGRHEPDWYWAVGIIAVSIATTSFILNNLLFAVFVSVSTIALFLRTLQKPRVIEYALTSKGIWIDRNFHAWKSIESFSIEETEESPLLLIKYKALTMPLLVIPLKDIDHEALHAYLIMILAEAELHEPFSKKIMEFLGF